MTKTYILNLHGNSIRKKKNWLVKVNYSSLKRRNKKIYFSKVSVYMCNLFIYILFS
ncbi:hypothetical protein BGAPBR_K0045 (plasmid) [Borreliella garinii PBr]|uniref:Uncharacterized protein n=1 Tax=Borreliella garinii PBr TaxID=498743 RepID=B8F0S8_BORGR|nr:hypothetical protein BGAPBR_K0045 [Borreliella garinii PBr]